jgi:hypothetical protein
LFDDAPLSGELPDESLRSGNAMKNNAVCDARSQSSFGFPTIAAWLFWLWVKKYSGNIYLVSGALYFSH